ncbi:MAG: hypothetical protein LBO04_01950 [Spirochaetaceae bacterium]|jgi:deoxycytidine triphosphate deaminase|nr:hypothetical protein [Spirochaetaceae bacterium]
MARTALEKFKEFEYNDPYKDMAPALLNNADIKKYINKAGIVDPFYEKDLNGITYEARLEGKARFWNYDDKHPEIKEKKDVYIMREKNKFSYGEKYKYGLKIVDHIILQPNSITYITLEPFFRIPAYIVARFNLKINLIYKGLLLGTGPIVDPCFKGHLSIPLHNLTLNNYKLRGGEPIIAMEFTKTSPNKSWDKARADEEEAEIKHFSGGNTENRDVYYYVNNALLGEESSDIVSASVRYSTLKKELEKRKKWDWGIIIGGVISVVILIISLIYPLFSAYNEIQKERIKYQEIQYQLEKKITALEQRLLGTANDSKGMEAKTELRDKIADLETGNEKTSR